MLMCYYHIELCQLFSFTLSALARGPTLCFTSRHVTSRHVTSRHVTSRHVYAYPGGGQVPFVVVSLPLIKRTFQTKADLLKTSVLYILFNKTLEQISLLRKFPLFKSGFRKVKEVTAVAPSVILVMGVKVIFCS